MLVILALRKLRKKDQKFEASLSPANGSQKNPKSLLLFKPNLTSFSSSLFYFSEFKLEFELRSLCLQDTYSTNELLCQPSLSS
jgi:hypothetical protein